MELFTTPTTKMAASTSDFGYNLFRALASRDTTTNIFLSPISVTAALTQLSMGDNTNTLHIKATKVYMAREDSFICIARITNSLS